MANFANLLTERWPSNMVGQYIYYPQEPTQASKVFNLTLSLFLDDNLVFTNVVKITEFERSLQLHIRDL